MIKTRAKIGVLAVLLVFAAAFVFAQESSTYKATFEEVYGDADNFFDSADWKDVTFDNIFFYSSFGANIAQGKVDLGLALKPGNLYVALYYNGSLDKRFEEAYTGTEYLSLTGKPNDPLPINVSASNKNNPNALYGALVGLDGGMGIKFTFEDNLGVIGTKGATGFPYSETWIGSLTPYIELGGLGAISQIGLRVPVVYNRTVGTTSTGTNSVSYTSSDLDEDGNAITGQAGILEAEGNYLEPAIFLKMNFGSLYIYNDLALRLYGIPDVKSGGKAGSQSGVGLVNTVVNYDTDKTTRTAVWDNRFYIKDELTPLYNFNKETDKLAWSASAFMPITVGLTAHSLNYLNEDGNIPANNRDFKKYYEGSEFEFGLAPTLSAGVQFKVFPMLSLQGGVRVRLFDWSLVYSSTKKVEYTGTDKTNFDAITTLSHSGDSSSTEYTFKYTEADIAAGFTFNFKDKAALDMAFIYYADPELGNGKGNSETSVVLTLKF